MTKQSSHPIDFLDWEDVGSMAADTYQKRPLWTKEKDLCDLGYGTDDDLNGV